MLRPFPIILSALLFFTAAQARAEISWQANWTPGSLAKVVGPSSVIDFTNLHRVQSLSCARNPGFGEVCTGFVV
jgi:hypothetical protein